MNRRPSRVPRVLSIGAAIQDVFLRNSPAFRTVKIDSTHEMTELELGAKIDVNKIDFSTGGGATNAAVTFARQGLYSSFMGVVGRDIPGSTILKVLDEESVDTSRVIMDEDYNTDYSTVILAPNGERTILTYRGASAQLKSEDLAIRRNEFDWLYVSNLAGRMDFIDDVFSQARDNSVKIVWNPGKKELLEDKKMKPLLEDVEVLIVNKQEAQTIFEGGHLKNWYTML